MENDDSTNKIKNSFVSGNTSAIENTSVTENISAIEKNTSVITKFIQAYVEQYPDKYQVPVLWRTPLVGFADAFDSYIRNLPELILKEHKLPQDFMEDPTAVISYFLPFRPELAQTNTGVPDHYASSAWAEAYTITNTMIGRLNQALAEKITAMGYRAAVPDNVGMLPEVLMSNWSQRHLAYAAGLGTFGINNMLITARGCCGRYGSIVADIPVLKPGALKQENCLYKRNGGCKKCIKNCFSGALTTEGFDREKCFSACSRNLERYGVDVCGKCDVDIPCAFAAP